MMSKSIKTFFAIAALLIVAFPAWALSLEQAKSQGLVGEQLNGYLGAVGNSPSAEVRNLVNSINQQRNELYKQRARESSVTLDVFEARAGERLRERANSGEFIQDSNGQWRRK
ncbi:hypothetical protein D791_00151 [Nitrincola nitratireducens]|uniref:DUF1318 domain-containing protein n=2 Tax=Oceanospirillaceae TaxID=135620 RepID=W9V0G3_9GAMM|nr:hypothetical protein D791_00151 [Nitrincola nitratireducens]